MISKAKVKFIKSLQLKKYRKEEQSFMVEGEKGVAELLKSSFDVQWIAATKEFIAQNQKLLISKDIELIETDALELSQVGTFQSNDAALAVAKMQPNAKLIINHEFALVLDDIRDPGNLGTIIRTADWYGINKIVASEETADFYNPKVINSTMGSFCRVKVFYTNIAEYLNSSSITVYGTFLEGKNVHEVKFGKEGLIVIGNEAQGISKSVEKLINERITIPRRGDAESLNASIATAIILDNIFR